MHRLRWVSHSSKPPRSAKVTSPSTTKAPTTTTPQPKLIYARTFTPAQQEVAKGYFAAEKAFVNASAEPTVTGTLLSATHAGPMLAAARRDIRTLAERHQAVRLPKHSQYLIRIDQVSLHGGDAVVQLCAVDDGVLFQRTTGKIVDASTVSRMRRATCGPRVVIGCSLTAVPIRHNREHERVGKPASAPLDLGCDHWRRRGHNCRHHGSVAGARGGPSHDPSPTPPPTTSVRAGSGHDRPRVEIGRRSQIPGSGHRVSGRRSPVVCRWYTTKSGTGRWRRPLLG